MIGSILSYLIAVCLFSASVLATAHILLTKHDVRAAIGWVAIVWLLPGAGTIGYIILGVNRIHRGAERRRQLLLGDAAFRAGEAPRQLHLLDPTSAPRFASHARLAHYMTDMALKGGNSLEMLINGDAAYPAMLNAIDGAKQFVALSTYIYDWDRVGRAFADALKRATERGVRVCVLVDAMGSFMIARRLRRMGIDARSFNVPGPAHLAFLNLRTHRKLLLVDGRLGFTGGMNIRDVHCEAGERDFLSQDVMFQVEGPVLRQLARVFEDDWRFAGGDRLDGLLGEEPRPEDMVGPAVLRTVPDGPVENVSATAWIIENALFIARRRIRITTPYFLPDVNLISALSQAALRGVTVDILVPERNNMKIVGWASEALYGALLKYGVNIYLTAPPLDHTKMMVVDDYWALIGSSNWDARSFRLNFELNVEIYDPVMARKLDAFLAEKVERAHKLSWDEVDDWSLLRILRNRAFWLMSPYL